MSAQDLERMARELLAAEFERSGKLVTAGSLREGSTAAFDMAAIRAIVAALRQQPAPVDLEQVDRTDRELLTEFIRICREHKPVGQWPGERLCAAIERVMERDKAFRFIAEADMAPERGHNGRGGDADRPFSGPRRAAPHQPAPVVDDARMARALEWVRTNAAFEFPHIREHLPAIEEAIAAYDQNCGARTVRMVDDAMVDAVWSELDPSDVPGLTRRKLRAALNVALARAQGVQS